MEKPGFKQLSVQIPEKLWEDFAAAHRKAGQSQQGAVAAALAWYLTASVNARGKAADAAYTRYYNEKG